MFPVLAGRIKMVKGSWACIGSRVRNKKNEVRISFIFICYYKNPKRFKYKLAVNEFATNK
ncbi:MAG: hypothetical protein A2W96_02200 [Bacteroidetes bacterium GWD2_40_43]|nr:MAG: hypothetical protein A2W96_02200 [Bacteroidetes bacterium GWD2_40_43]